MIINSYRFHIETTSFIRVEESLPPMGKQPNEFE